MITQTQLAGMMPSANAKTIELYYPHFVNLMPIYSIGLAIEMAHFFAQIGHESGDLLYSQEIASGDAYEGRRGLGNTQPGDGPRFKGRGFIQLTGRFNYMDFGHAKGRDFVTDPNPKLIATDPELCVEVSCWFWRVNGLNDLAKLDNLTAVTKRINGGLNGLQDRSMRLVRCKKILGLL